MQIKKELFNTMITCAGLYNTKAKLYDNDFRIEAKDFDSEDFTNAFIELALSYFSDKLEQDIKERKERLEYEESNRHDQ